MLAALTIATMPARMASGRSDHASMSRSRSASRASESQVFRLDKTTGGVEPGSVYRDWIRGLMRGLIVDDLACENLLHDTRLDRPPVLVNPQREAATGYTF